MTLFDATPPNLTKKDVEGSIWETLAALQGGDQAHPFAIDSPAQEEGNQLVAGQTRKLTYRGSGQVLLYNIDLPSGVTLALSLDGTVKRFSHGGEAGVLRWEFGKSPLRFSNSLEIVVTNTTGVGQSYRVHVSGA
jgi:hypothetical protein